MNLSKKNLYTFYFVIIIVFFLINPIFAGFPYANINFIHTAPGGKVKYSISAGLNVPNENSKSFLRVSYKKFDEDDSNYQMLHEVSNGEIKKKSSYPYDNYYFISQDFKDVFPMGKYKIRVEIWTQTKSNDEWSEPVHYSGYDKEIVVNSDLIEGSFYNEPLILSGGSYKIGYGVYTYKGVSITNAQINSNSSYSKISVGSYAIISNSEIYIPLSFQDNSEISESFIINDSKVHANLLINAKKIEIKNNKFNNNHVYIKSNTFSQILIEDNSELFLNSDYYYLGSEQSGDIIINNNDNLIIHLYCSNIKSSNFIIKNNKIKKIDLSLSDLSNLLMTGNIINAEGGVYILNMSYDAVNLNVYNSLIEKNIIIGAKDGYTGTSTALKITGNKNIIRNNTIHGYFSDGLKIKGRENIVKQNHIFSESTLVTPIFLDNASNNLIENNDLKCGGMKTTTNYSNAGIELYVGDKDNKITKNLIDNCTIGLYVNSLSEKSEKNCITGNEISGNEFHSYRNIIYGCFYNNKFYNNSVDAVNAFYEGAISFPFGELDCGEKECENEWFISPESKTNVVGGPSVGGNFWKYFPCTDANKDGFCDSEYKFEKNGKTYILDKHPLFRNKLVISPGIYNPVNRAWSVKKEPVKVVQLRVKNNDIPKGSGDIKKLTFRYKGTGEIGDIEKVILYKDKLCKFSSGLIKIGEGNFSNSKISFNISDSLSDNNQICYVLEYVINNEISNASISKSDYCPCTTYGVEVYSSDTEIEVENEPYQVMGYVTGSINASIPEIAFVNENKYQYICGKNQEPGKKLSVKLDKYVKKECYGNWAAKFKIEEVPDGAKGALIKYGNEKKAEIEVPFDANGIAEASVICGDKKGVYKIGVYPVPYNNNPVNCPELMPSEPLLSFEVTEVEPVLKATLDSSKKGVNDDILSTFLSTIDAVNKLTTEVELPSWAPKIKSVTYESNWAGSKSVSSEPFEALFNMSDLKENSKLIQKVEFEDGTIIKKEYSFYAIELPEWVNTFNGFPYEGITFGFNEEIKGYELDFNFPDDFIWSNPIPDSIALLGGAENEQEFNCEAKATYFITGESKFYGKGSFTGSLLGHEAEAKGKIEISFDKEFLVKENPAPFGKFSGNISFEIEPRTIGSKTVLIYGVPVTVTVEAGGNIKIFADGKLIFHKTLKLKEIGFVPGITVVLTIDASVSAAFGLAKVGVLASPTGTIKIKLKYTTEEGKVVEEAFGGEFSVPVTVYGSLFWGAAESDLAETEFGPWKFGDEVGSAAYIKKSMIKKSSTNNKFYSTGAIAVNEQGKTMKVYTELQYGTSVTAISYDFSGSVSSIEYYFPNNNWETDPSVTFLSGDKALALWTSNDGESNLNKLNEILNHQDIAYAYFNGATWEKQGYVIDDENADGSSKVAYDGSSKAMAVWIHNSGQGEEYTLDKSKFSIYYALFDENTKEWSNVSYIPGTDNGTGDFMVDVIGMGTDKFMVLWIRDVDGKLFNLLDNITKGSNVDTTNKDCNVVYSIYENGAWSKIESVTNENNFTELMVKAAYNKSTGDTAAVWVSNENGKKKLYLSKYINGKWSSPIQLDESDYLIEDPVLNIDNNHVATVIYRKFSGKTEGLYKVEKNIGEVVTSEIKVTQVTEGTNMWNVSTIGKDGKLILGWTDVKNTGKVKTANYDGNINSKINEDNLTVSSYDNSTGKWKGIKLTVPLSIGKTGKYQVKAVLYKGGKIIAKGESEAKDFAEDNSTVEVIFSGRYIKSSLTDGPYQVGGIKLFYLNPEGIIVDSSKLQLSTASYKYSDFIDGVIEIDKKIYAGKEAKIVVEVNDKSSSLAEVCVTTSVDNSSKTVKLDNFGNGYFKKEINLDGLTLEDGCLIFLTYVDGKKNIFQQAALWIEKPPTIYELKVKIDNYTGDNRITGLDGGIDCPNNCYESIDNGSEVTLTAVTDNESEFTGWEGVACDNSSTECTFTIDNDTQVKAYFKEKEPEYIEDNSGDVTETGKKVKRAMTIAEGWQLINVPVNGDYNTGEKFSKSTTIWGWTGSNWEIWSGDTNITNLLNQYKITILSKLESGKGYWLNSGTTYTENFEGMSYGKDKINLSSGWNLVGCGVKLNANDFSEAKTLWQWSGSNWKVWSSESPIMTLLNQYKIEIANELKAGEGFWINK